MNIISYIYNKLFPENKIEELELNNTIEELNEIIIDKEYNINMKLIDINYEINNKIIDYNYEMLMQIRKNTYNTNQKIIKIKMDLYVKLMVIENNILKINKRLNINKDKYD
jgi:hypothetical protein